VTLRKQLILRLGAAFLLCILTFGGFVLLHIHDMEMGEVDDEAHLVLEVTQSLLWIFVPLAAIILFWTFLWLKRIEGRFEALMVYSEQFDPRKEPLASPGRQTLDELDKLDRVLEQLRRRLAKSWDQIQTFTMQASHELKTPLAIMRADFEQALKREDAGLPMTNEWMHSAIDELDRLTTIVDQLDYLTKADAGRFQMEFVQINLAEVVGSIQEDTEMLAEAEGIVLRPCRTEPCIILGDGKRLRQLLLNLISNALKHNVPGGWIELKQTGRKVLVRNSSHEISAEDQSHLFDRFFRTQETQRRKVEGSGLGLSLVRWIAQEHRASVEFRNYSEAGGFVSEVTLSLPE
jgi:two-component system, OmpR family, heavy metal sensor histidine kinase CusS